MKPIQLLASVLCLVCALLLVSGCEKKPVTKTKPPRPPRTNTVHKVVVKKTAREAQAGTSAFMDKRNGFRDVTFGAAETNVSNLLILRRDDASRLRTYTRTGDELSFEGVPLNAIEYTFLDGRLAQILVKWNIECSNSVVDMPPSTDVSVKTSRLYGRPKKYSIRKDGSEYLWRGRSVEILVSETRQRGVANQRQGGWFMVPVTSGQMAISSIPILQGSGSYATGTSTNSSDGL